MKKITGKNFHKGLNYFLFIFFILSSCISVYTFTIGFHNNDLGHNLRWINTEFDIDLKDLSSDGLLNSPDDMVVNGFNLMIRGASCFGLSMFILGFYAHKILLKW